MSEVIEEGLSLSRTQALIMARELAPQEGLFPRSFEKGKMKRQLSQKNTFDANGWLRVGYTGSQIHMSEDYINTGSEYLVCAGFCALGLPASDAFWTNPYAEWTSKKAWNNVEVPADHSIGN